MIFCIQASNPKALEKYDKTDDTLSSAIETSFPMRTEDAIMIWNHIYIPLSYKYDISYMINDIIDMLKMLRENSTGMLKIDWLPNTFRSDWIIKWNDNQINIETFWGDTVGNLVETLNDNPNISIEKYDFIKEWKKLLSNIINGLKKCNYNEANMPKMMELIHEFSLIDGTGILYES